MKPIIGIVAAMTIPALVMNTEAAKNKAILKKTYRGKVNGKEILYNNANILS